MDNRIKVRLLHDAYNNFTLIKVSASALSYLAESIKMVSIKDSKTDIVLEKIMESHCSGRRSSKIYTRA
jgi:hypothetical protein